MTIDEYFGDWMKVLDRKETVKIMNWLKTTDSSTLCPSIKNVFKAFKLCSYNECKVIDETNSELTTERLALVKAIKITLENALNLLGIEVKEDM